MANHHGWTTPLDTNVRTAGYADDPQPLPDPDTWANPITGDWSTAGDWSIGVFPTAATDAAITVAGPAYTVTVSDAEAARSLLLDAAAATLAVAGTLSLTDTLALSAGTLALTGTLAGGTLARGGGTLLAQGGTLAGVTYDGTLDLSAAGASLTVLDDLTLAGTDGSGLATVLLTGDGSSINIANDTPAATTTLDRAIIDFGGDFGVGTAASIADDGFQSLPSTLVLGSGLDVVQTGPLAAIYGPGDHGDDIINAGTITAAQTGGDFVIRDRDITNTGTISVAGTDTFEIDAEDASNAGLMTVGDEGNLTINAAFSTSGTLQLSGSASLLVTSFFDNTGTIAVTGGVLDFAFLVETDELGALSDVGGEVDITGELDNTGATLDIGSGTALGVLTLGGGTITGGVIDDAGGGLQIGDESSSFGTLDGVTYRGVLDSGGAPFPQGGLVIADGITLQSADGTAPGTLLAEGGVQIDDTTTLDDATIELDGYVRQYPMGGGDYFAAVLYDHDTTGNGAVLTLGPGLTLTGTTGEIVTDAAAGDDVVNQGSMLFGDGGTFEIDTENFANSGLLQASDGALVVLDADWTDIGTTVIETGAELDFTGDITTAQLEDVVYAGGTLVFAGILDNTDSTLNISQALGDFILGFDPSSGNTTIIRGGTVDVASGASLGFRPAYFPIDNCTLDGVTFEGTLDLSAVGITIDLTDGSTLRNASVLLTGSGSTLAVDPTTTILDSTIDIGNDDGGATLVLDGTFAAGSSIIQVGSLAAIDTNDFVNQGAIAAEYSGGEFDVLGDSFSNAGSLAVGGGDSLDVQTSVFANSATIALSGGTIAGTALNNTGSLSGYGTLADAVTNDGIIEAAGGLLALAGGVSGAGSLQIDSLAMLELGGAVAAGALVTFDGQDATLKLDDPAAFRGTIADFGDGRTIDLAGIADAASASISGNTLTVSLRNGGSVALSLDASSYGGGQLTLGSDGAGGTTITDLQPAVPAPHMPLSYDLGAHHIGAVVSKALSLTNIGGPLAAALEASIGGATTGVTASGTASIASGATDSQHLLIGLDTSTAGAKSGTATIDLASQGSAFDSLGTTTLGDEVLQVTGAVYALARAAFSDTTPVLHVGASGIEHLTVSNVSGDGAYSEGLIATAESATGLSGASGTTGLIADGDSDSVSLTYDVDTATAGVVDGLIKVGLTSDGAGTSGLGDTSIGSDSVQITATIDNFATAAVALIGAIGVLTQAGKAFTLNLGTLTEGSGPITARFEIVNAAAGPADLLSGAFSETGSTGFTNAGLAAFSGLGAGQADMAPAVTLSTSQSGTFSETITLDPTGSNPSGYSGALTPETITVVGEVAPFGIVQNTGAAGSAGGIGRKGGAGQPAVAIADAAGVADNAAQAQGGAGGAGGSGANAATGAGGNAAAGGEGGSADADATTSVSDPMTQASATADATGGTGGAAGTPGRGTTSGRGAAGGTGGASTATASATNTAGAASASATADGGTGGSASSAGGGGGTGGVASGTTATANGSTRATACVTQTGGSGGAGTAGANGGNGASSTLNNAVSGTTDGGTLTLYQDAIGGNGGGSDTGFGGAAGAAASALTVTRSQTDSAVIDATVEAQGGDAGAGALYHPEGGTAAVHADITGTQDVTVKGVATGGTSPEGLGGAASAVVSGTGGGVVTASATSTGGAGAADTGGGWGGGASTDATASASGTSAVATATGVGGQGGGGTGAGNAGGAGAAAIGTSAAVTGTTSASASATQSGGAGGAGRFGASGGAGAGSNLQNAVGGTTEDGLLTVIQIAEGGAGGASDSGAGGAGGDAISDLTLNDTTNPDPSASITAEVTGVGGAGGASMSGTGGAGGSTWESASITGAGVVSLTTTAVGGSGGTAGGDARAAALAVGAQVDVTANATGGSGQTGPGAAAANATGTAVSGTADAAATTALAVAGPVSSVSAGASAVVDGAATAAAQASFGGTVPAFLSGVAAVADIMALPTAAGVTALLAGDPNIKAALGASPTLYAAGEIGGGHSASGTGTQTAIASTDIKLDRLQLASTPDLFLAFDRVSRGSVGSISDITLSVYADGASLLSQDFSSAAAAQTWFTDHPIDLGSLATGALAASPTLDLHVALSVTTTQAGGSFDTQYLIGAAPAAPQWAIAA